MGCVIFFVALLILAGIALAFDVPVWAAILILFGFLFVVAILWAGAASLKSENRKRVMLITIFVVVLIILGIFFMRACADVWGDTDSGSDWDKCMKCEGDGKYVNDIGFNVTCPRCNGVGYIP